MSRFSTSHLRQLFVVLFLCFSYAAFATIDIVSKRASSSDIVCDGSITLLAEGTAGPFQVELIGPTYRNLDGVSGQIVLNGLCDGAYEIIVTNSYRCEKTINTTLGCSLEAVPSVIPSCTTGGGAISFTPQNGTPPYKYKWRNVAGTYASLDQNISNLPPDDYQVTVVDANGCRASTTTPISTTPTGEDAIYPYIQKVEVYVTVNAVRTLIYEGAWGSSAPNCLKYQGDTKPITQELYDAIKNGQATMEVIATASKALSTLTATLPSIGGAQSAGSGGGATWTFNFPTNVSAGMITANGIEMPIDFVGEDSRGDKLLKLRQLSSDFTRCASLPTLGQNCTWNPKPNAGTDNAHVVQTSCISTAFSIATTNVQYNCDNLADVCIQVNNGGSGTYTFQWENGQIGNCATNLTPGNCYAITVIDACGASKTECINVPNSNIPSLAIQNVEVQNYCGSTQAGSLNVTANFGKSPYTYSWSGEGGFTANTAQINNLAIGEYCVTVTDQCGQTAITCRTITNVSNSLTVQATQNKPACAPDGAGSLLDINVSPIGTYQYRWSNGAVTDDIQNVAAGNYTVSITDGNGCITTSSVTIQQNPVIYLENVEQAISHPSSCGATDGEIYFRFGGPVGGTINTPTDYDWDWSNGDPGRGHITNLSSGIYTLSITDLVGCTSIFEIELIGQDEPQIYSDILPSCTDNSVGAIALFVYENAPTSPPKTYTFNWATLDDASGVVEYAATGLAPGNYSVTISDDTHACGDIVRTYTVPALTASAPLQVEGIITKTCPENPTGKIHLQINGGVPFPSDAHYEPYQISWENSAPFSQRENLEPGDYQVTVTDYCRTSVVKTFKVVADPALVFDVVATAISHTTSEQEFGSIAVQPTVPGSYSYQWDNNATAPTINGLTPDVYTVTVTNNATGCKIVREFEVEGCIDVASFDAIIVGGSALDPTRSFEFQIQISENYELFTETFPSNYSIIWKEPVQDNIVGYGGKIILPSNYPHNAVRAIISNGCHTLELTKHILRCNTNENLENIFIIKKNLPCTGFNDGSVVVSIPNPLGEQVSVEFNDLQIPTHVQGTNNIITEIGSLYGQQSYTININIGTCTFNFSFQLDEKEINREFHHVDRLAGICYYEQNCSNIDFGEEFYFHEEAKIAWEEAGSNFFGAYPECKAPMYCGDLNVGIKKFDTKWVYAREYQYILINAGLIDEWNALSGKLGDAHACRKVLYCTGDLSFITSVPVAPRLHGLFNGKPDRYTADEPKEIIPGDDDCTLVRCPQLLFVVDNSYLACWDSDKDPGFEGSRPDAVNNCEVRTGNVYELYLLYNALKGQLPTIISTGLGQFLELHGDDPEAKCATVTYCANTLQYIGDNRAFIQCNADIFACDGVTKIGETCDPSAIRDENGNIVGYKIMCESVGIGVGVGQFCSPDIKIISNCDPPGPGLTFELDKTWENTKETFSKVEDFFKNVFGEVRDAAGEVLDVVKIPFVEGAEFTFQAAKNVVKLLFPKGVTCPSVNPLLPESTEEDLYPKIVLDTFQNEVLQNFGIAKYAELPIPRGIVKNGNDRIYYKYDDAEDKISKDITSTIEYSIEDWDYEHLIYVRQILKDQESELAFEDTAVAWVNSISADTSFNIKHLSSEGYNITLGGVFQGTLTYDSTVVAHSDSLSSFLFRIDKDGILLNAHIELV